MKTLAAVAATMIAASCAYTSPPPPSVATVETLNTEGRCAIATGSTITDAKVTEVYQIGRVPETVFDVRLDCTNRCGTQYIRFQASSVPVADRTFLLALTAVTSGQLVDISVVSKDGDAVCVPEDAGTPRESGDWIRLKSRPN